MPAAESRRTAAQSAAATLSAQHPRARRRRQPGDVVEILRRVGNAVQRAQVVAAAQERALGRARLPQRPLAGHAR